MLRTALGTGSLFQGTSPVLATGTHLEAHFPAWISTQPFFPRAALIASN